jgi:hypothetical protein
MRRRLRSFAGRAATYKGRTWNRRLGDTILPPGQHISVVNRPFPTFLILFDRLANVIRRTRPKSAEEGKGDT